MIKKVIAIGCLVCGSLLTLLGGIAVYSFSIGKPVRFTINTEVQGDWVMEHGVWLSVPSIGNLGLFFSLVTILFAVGYLLLRENRKPDRV